MSQSSDAPLVRFHLQRLSTSVKTEHRTESRPILGETGFVSMPFLVGAYVSSHPRYQEDRLFTVKQIRLDEEVVIEAADTAHRLRAGDNITLVHKGEEVRVTLEAFTSRNELRDLNESD